MLPAPPQTTARRNARRIRGSRPGSRRCGTASPGHPRAPAALPRAATGPAPMPGGRSGPHTSARRHPQYPAGVQPRNKLLVADNAGKKATSQPPNPPVRYYGFLPPFFRIWFGPGEGGGGGGRFLTVLTDARTSAVRSLSYICTLSINVKESHPNPHTMGREDCQKIIHAPQPSLLHDPYTPHIHTRHPTYTHAPHTHTPHATPQVWSPNKHAL